MNASIHVAFSVYALIQITALNFNIDYDVNLSFVTFFGTIVTYNFIKYGSKAKKYFLVEEGQDKIIQLFSVFSGISMLFFVFKLDSKTLLGLAFLTLISILYIVPFYAPQKNFRNLKGIKIYIVALVWSGTTVFLPLLNDISFINNDILIEGIQRFLFVLVIMLPFEIRDLQVDDHSLYTIPQRIGVKKTKKLGIFLILLFWILTFFKDYFLWKNVMVLFIVKTAVIFFVINAKKHQSKYYSGLFVESLPILWWAGIKIISLN